MIGAIIGDVVGSVYEFNNHRSKEFPLFQVKSSFTDDSVLTFATAKVLLDGGDYATTYQRFARVYPHRGYGGRFSRWIKLDDPKPYNSFGNGSAMRVSPVGFAFADAETTLAESKRSAEVTHNHPEGIKGAQSVAAAIFLARTGMDRDGIRAELEGRFGYNLHRPWEEIQPGYSFDETCQGSVPEALICALTSTSFENAVRRAVALGGDADTQAAIAGSVAEALYGGVPATIATEARARLTPRFDSIVTTFQETYDLPWS